VFVSNIKVLTVQLLLYYLALLMAVSEMSKATTKQSPFPSAN